MMATCQMRTETWATLNKLTTLALLSNNSNQLMTTTTELFHNNSTKLLAATALLPSNNTKPQEVLVIPPLQSKALRTSDVTLLFGFFVGQRFQELVCFLQDLCLCTKFLMRFSCFCEKYMQLR